MIEVMEPIEKLTDLKKGILVPEEDFELFLRRFDWTWHQLAREEFPEPFIDLDHFQLACICADPVLWVQAFLREPEDPDHKDPYSLWDYQKGSLSYPGHTIHKTASEVGKTRELVAYGLYKAFTIRNGSGLIGAPMQSHLDEVIEAMDNQFMWNPDLGRARWHKRYKDGWKKHPHHAFYFTNGFKIDFKPSGDRGVAYRGVHAKTFAIKDESVKDKNKQQWSEFWRAMKPGCIAKIYSVPDGDRSCEFYKLAQRAVKENGGSFKEGDSPDKKGTDPIFSKIQEKGTVPSRSIGTGTVPAQVKEGEIESFKDAPGHVKNIKFRLFHWRKSLMPYPFWSRERKRFFIDQYGGEDSPEYKHNVEGEDGDPENPVFPWHQFKFGIKDIPEYRCLKVLVNNTHNEVVITGYKCEFEVGNDGPVPRQVILMDETFTASTFFEGDNPRKGTVPNLPPSAGNFGTVPEVRPLESEFRRLIKSFFVSVPGLKRGGADFGFSGDPTEIKVKLIIGKKERTVARLHLKHVTYDQQCQALDAMDDVYGPKESISWGTDFGNAGAAVAHDLQGLSQYQDKDYDDRLKGFMFESTTDNVDDEREPIIDAKTGQPAKITLKELATDILTKKMQRQELEYPADPDYILAYPNHTVRMGSRHRIYKKEDDHLIDADRAQTLAYLFQEIVEDLFASGN